MVRGAHRSFDLASEHAVAFYSGDEDLSVEVARFLGEGLDHGGTAVVVATPEHRSLIRSALADRRTCDTDRYLDLDAAATLALISPGGVPERAAFSATLDPILTAAAAIGPLRVFGEMVALLWNDGLLTEALELEEIWNEFGQRHDFKLLCAYPRVVLDGAGNLGSAKIICDRHSHASTLGEPCVSDTRGAVATRSFVPDANTLRSLRQFVGQVLDDWGLATRQEDAQLIASELGTNATRHAVSPFRMTLSRRPTTLTLAVRDASIVPPRRRMPGQSDIGGRGLALVETVADAWGTTLESDGKTVWAQLAL